MPINSLKPLFDKGRLVQVKPTTNVDDEVSISNRLSLRDSEPASPIDATEVSECQSFGDGTTLAAAKTKAKAACLSHI
jgi:hypothetical protein